MSVPCQRYATHASNAARTNRYSSACAHPLLLGVAFAAFVGMLSIGSASQKAHLVSVLELCQLIPPRCCASLATPPEQQSHMHTPSTKGGKLALAQQLKVVLVGGPAPLMSTN